MARETDAWYDQYIYIESALISNDRSIDWILYTKFYSIYRVSWTTHPSKM